MGFSNDVTYKNFLEVAVEKGQLKDAMFAFDLESVDEKTYFYAGSDSFPPHIL